jgi:hypothetical protein
MDLPQSEVVGKPELSIELFADWPKGRDVRSGRLRTWLHGRLVEAELAVLFDFLAETPLVTEEATVELTSP